jgi:hypothetical protein
VKQGAAGVRKITYVNCTAYKSGSINVLTI